MNKNIGLIDRVTRIAAGIALIVAGLIFKSWWGAVGVVPLATAFLRWCPAYTLFGLNTSRNGLCAADKNAGRHLGKASGA